MKIERLKIVELHGYINKDIFFNEDVNLLVGINGSGKTSILNIINWIIKPSMPHLCVTEFKTIQLFFQFKERKYEILCKHNKTTFKYKVILLEKEEYHPLTVRLIVPPCDIKNDNDLKVNLLHEYDKLGPEKKEKRTWDFILSLPNPTVIGLDRNLYAEDSNKMYVEKSIRDKVISKDISIAGSPLDKVKEIVNTEYRKKKNTILNLTSKLKNSLMLSTFDGSITIDSLNHITTPKDTLTEVQINRAEKRINEYFDNFEKDVLDDVERNMLSNYFSQLKYLTKEFQEKPDNVTTKLLYGLNVNQFNKINKLLKKFEEFEKESNKALEEINTYIDTLNLFFIDSSKRLIFKEDIAELMFNILDENRKTISEYKDIKYLSSGEQQILILFSYIAFNGNDGRIFIIDEPELSLHIKWQENFLNLLEKITPKKTQLILATHSPILADKKREKTILLLPYNK